jgi:hypothetical protein
MDYIKDSDEEQEYHVAQRSAQWRQWAARRPERWAKLDRWDWARECEYERRCYFTGD